jgi:hypothetical protein
LSHFQFKFKRWKLRPATKSRSEITKWLQRVKNDALSIFRRGLYSGPHSGRLYARRGGRVHQASAAGECPANDTGALGRSLKAMSNQERVDIGTGVHYAQYLRTGTGRMRRRKMSDTALQQAARDQRGTVRFAVWGKHRGRTRD